MRLQALIDGLDVRAVPASATAPLAPDWGDVRICDLTEDSRTIMPGSLFVARRGGKNDGRQFAASAVAQGAIAVLTAGLVALAAMLAILASQRHWRTLAVRRAQIGQSRQGGVE